MGKIMELHDSSNANYVETGEHTKGKTEFNDDIMALLSLAAFISSTFRPSIPPSFFTLFLEEGGSCISGFRRMISNDSINHGKVLRANGNISPVRQNYSGSIRVAIFCFCEAGNTFSFVGSFR
jgi:hypothetical protein